MELLVENIVVFWVVEVIANGVDFKFRCYFVYLLLEYGHLALAYVLSAEVELSVEVCLLDVVVV